MPHKLSHSQFIDYTNSAMRLVAALLRQTSSDMTDVLSIMNVNNGVAAILLQTYRLSMSMYK